MVGVRIPTLHMYIMYCPYQLSYAQEDNQYKKFDDVNKTPKEISKRLIRIKPQMSKKEKLMYYCYNKPS